ncbi:MAG: OmpA family protein [Rhodothermales bacterium]
MKPVQRRRLSYDVLNHEHFSMMKRIQQSTHLLLASLVFVALTLSGCASMNQTEKGAATGAGAGAVVGGVVGKVTGKGTAKGAIIGAMLGGAAGAIIGNQMDKQAEELEDELEGAEVERVGEGIQVTFESGILFGFDSSSLTPDARASLNQLAQSLNQYDNTELLVIGHTDSKGSDDYNQQLSERRANAAASYLVSQGVAPNRITTLGKGETEAIATNETEAGRAQNRRVEVAIFADDTFRQQADGG